MTLVTLTTDFGLRDFYAAAVVGELYKHIPDVRVEAVNHQIPKYNTIEGAMFLKNSWKSFPEGTIHIVSINNHYSQYPQYIAVEYDGHYFLGADNGLLNLVFDEHTPATRIFSIDLPINDEDASFPSKSLFVKAAAHIAKGGTLEFLGKPIDSLSMALMPAPTYNGYSITASILYIDSYGNVITNLTPQFLNQYRNNRNIRILGIDRNFSITKLDRNYTDVEAGDDVAFFNSMGYLEIASRNGNAAQLHGFERNKHVYIEFDD